MFQYQRCQPKFLSFRIWSSMTAISRRIGIDVTEWNPTAQEMIKGMYEEAGYEMPGIVYWNIQSRQDNIPTRFDEMGTALVSGFSPSIMKSILSCQDMTPYNMMMETIGSTRYESITSLMGRPKNLFGRLKLNQRERGGHGPPPC